MPDLLTPDELAVIAEREAKATEGEWRWLFRDKLPIEAWHEPHCLIGANDAKVVISLNDRYQGYPECGEDLRVDIEEADRDFIAHARADIPALLRHIAALEARTPAPADDPELDGTDFAHPAWWRGHDQTTAMFCHHVQVILDGRAVKDESVSPEPWHTIRQRLLALMEKPAPALRETLAREQVAANVLCDTHEELGMHRAYVEDLTKERDALKADLAAARKELAGLKGGAA